MTVKINGYADLWYWEANSATQSYEHTPSTGKHVIRFGWKWNSKLHPDKVLETISVTNLFTGLVDEYNGKIRDHYD